MKLIWQPEPVTRRMADIASTALLWGFDSLELRSVGSAEERVPDVSERRIREACRESELDVAVVDPGYLSGDPADSPAWMNELAMLPEVVGFASRIGCSQIMVGAFGGVGDDGDAEIDNEALSRSLARVLPELHRLATRTGCRFLIDATPGTRPALLDGLKDVTMRHDSVAAHLGTVRQVRITGDHKDTGEWTVTSDFSDTDPWLTYTRLLCDPVRSIDYDAADRLEETFQTVLAGSESSDVCLEITPVGDSDGLRAATALVRAARSAGIRK